MSNDTPRFLLASNKIVCDNNFIIHTKEPFMVVEVIANDIVNRINVNDSLTYFNESFTFIVRKTNSTSEVKKLKSILKRIAGWYGHLPMNKVPLSDNPINLKG